MTGFLLIGIYVLVLSTFLGFELINKVPPTLHTPLMSGANAISGITIVGSMTVVGMITPELSNVLVQRNSSRPNREFCRLDSTGIANA